MTDNVIQDAVSALPIWGSEESIKVDGQFGQTSPIPTVIYKVTFNTTRGKYFCCIKFKQVYEFSDYYSLSNGCKENGSIC